MIAPVPQTAPASLIVFSDDWGRHPSSCQHLTRHLLDHYRVLWVNTIGTRAPRLDLQTMRRGMEKLRQWRGTPVPADRPVGATHENLRVVSPRMWPWFRHRHDRLLNRWILQRQLAPLIQELPRPVAALTTLPITADLPDVLTDVCRWVYYCVDDFSLWPGLDGETLRVMDHHMIRRSDSIVAVSEALRTMIAAEGRSSTLLTHGVDVDFWRRPQHEEPSAIATIAGPRVVFWGVIDRRLDADMLRTLALNLAAQNGRMILVGPQQDPDPKIVRLPGVTLIPPQPIGALPGIAADADVLVMPYADLPVTRAMQPLKLKEYLATGKPVVVSRLPSTVPWSDCLDIADTPESFAQMVTERLRSGVSATQAEARQRLQQESWESRAAELQHAFVDEPAHDESSDGSCRSRHIQELTGHTEHQEIVLR